MQVKRFVAASMHQALKMVREELGPDAVILSNKRVAEGVELLIAAEPSDEHAVEQSAAQHALADNPFANNDYPDSGARTDAPVPSALEREVERMQRDAKQRAASLVASLAAKSQASARDLSSSADELREREDTNPFAGLAVSASQLDEKYLAADVVEVKNLAAKAAVLQSVSSSIGGVSSEKPTPQSKGDSQDTALANMRFELESMRDLLQQQLSAFAWGQYSQTNPQKASLWRRLKRMGISAAVARPLLDQSLEWSGDDPSDSSSIWQIMMAGLNDRLPVQRSDMVAGGGIFAFVGPTGAGKTTTIGKLATRYVLEHGANDVALVTTDTVRIAGHEQLRTFGRILNVAVKVVDKHNSLERVLYSLRHKSLVLIDTAGLGKGDPQLKQQLTAINELGDRAKTLLVIPTTSQGPVMSAAYHTYKTDSLCACILTKIDECASLGEAMSLAIEKALPIAYSTDGQGIPDDIARADKLGLIRTAIELAKPINTDDESMADELASLPGVNYQQNQAG